MKSTPPKKLTCISLGAGSSDLITLKALKAIKSTDAFLYLRANGKTFALDIALPHMAKTTDGKILFPIDITMSDTDEVISRAYDKAAEKIKQLLSKNKSVAFLCQGDAMFYGSFVYILDRLKGQIPIEIIAGVSSLNASASAAKIALTSKLETLSVVPAANSDEVILQHLKLSSNIVFVKLGRHFAKIKRIIKSQNLLDNSLCVIRASSEVEQIVALKHMDASEYFSLIIVKK